MAPSCAAVAIPGFAGNASARLDRSVLEHRNAVDMARANTNRRIYFLLGIVTESLASECQTVALNCEYKMAGQFIACS
jgi:hypothetical protein